MTKQKNNPIPTNLKYLYFAVFSSGMVTMGIEFGASRLLGNVFGTSNLVWASIVGLIMIYLTLGYFLGGKYADRFPTPKAMFTFMLFGALSAGIVPFISNPVLRFAANAFDALQVAFLAGAFISVLILFIIPITLFGMMSPFAIRLAITDPTSAGKVSGRIYAISTLGSFIGTFLPDLILIPWVGTTRTFVIFSVFLAVVALVGLFITGHQKRALQLIWAPIFILLLAYFWAKNPIKQTQGQIFETESSYNYIQVLDSSGFHLLRLNEGQGVHSIYHPDIIAYNGTWMHFLATPFYNPDYQTDDLKNVAIVGLAAGTVARQITEIYGDDVQIDGFEIDPEIIAVGEQYFGMTMPNLNAIAQDGRWALEHSDKKYDLIVIDAYRPPYIPWHMTTQEFFQIAYDHLTENGVVAINAGRTETDRRLIQVLSATMGSVFPSIHVMDVPETYNSIIAATKSPTTIANMEANFLNTYNAEQPQNVLTVAIYNTLTYAAPTPTGGMVYTDERAPVEWLLNDMVVRYVFSGLEN